MEGYEAVPMSGHSQDGRNAAVKAVLRGLDDMSAVVFFEKPLTSSDASGSGRVVIPKVGGDSVQRIRDFLGFH